MPYVLMIVSLLASMLSTGSEIMAVKPAESMITGESVSGRDSVDALINGRLYHYQAVKNGHPYFDSHNWVKSSVYTKYEEFDNVLLKYDIYQDVLIIPLYRKEGTFTVELNQQYIKGFLLDGHNFVNLNNVISNCNPNFQGYHELLYDGNIKLLLKWEKTIIDKDKVSGASFELSKTQYLLDDNQHHRLKGNRSLLKLFPGQKNAIRNYLRENHLYINRSPENQLVKLAGFIDQLTD